MPKLTLKIFLLDEGSASEVLDRALSVLQMGVQQKHYYVAEQYGDNDREVPIRGSDHVTPEASIVVKVDELDFLDPPPGKRQKVCEAWSSSQTES